MGIAWLCALTFATHGDVCCSLILCEEKFKSIFMLDSLLIACFHPPPLDVTLSERNSRAPENHTAGHSTCSGLILTCQKGSTVCLSSLPAPPAHTGQRGPQGAKRMPLQPNTYGATPGSAPPAFDVLRTNTPFKQSLFSKAPASPRPRDTADN